MKPIVPIVCSLLPFLAGNAISQVPLKQATSLTKARQMHGSVVLGDYLYVFGGHTVEDDFNATVEKARILADGRLSQWTPDRPMPQVRSYIMNSTVALNDVVYVIGGTTGDATPGSPEIKYKTTLIAKPDPETGQLSEWSESDPFPGQPISCFTVSTSPGFIHIIGGRTDSGDLTSDVITGVVGADGSIMAWEPAPPIPVPMWFHHSATAGSRVWVWGGLTEQTSASAMGRVFSAPITGNGRLGSWEENPKQVPVGIFRGANAVAGPYLMSFSTSYQGGATSSDVVFSAANGNQLMDWQRISTPLPMNNYVACAPDFRRGRIYIPGGQSEFAVPSDVVAYFQLTGAAQEAAVGGSNQTASADIQSNRQSSQQNELTYLTLEDLPDGAVQGFLPYEAARRTLLRSTKPMIVYFNLKGSRPSEQQVNTLRSDPAFQGLTEEAIFAWVDVQQSPQVAQSLGVYRAPTWILYNNLGIEQGRASQELNAQKLKAGLDAM